MDLELKKIELSKKKKELEEKEYDIGKLEKEEKKRLDIAAASIKKKASELNKKGSLGDALKWLDEAISNEENAEIRHLLQYHKGNLLYPANRISEALNAYLEAFNGSPFPQADYASKVASAYKKIGRVAESLKYNRIAYGIEPLLKHLLRVVKDSMKINEWSTFEKDVPIMLEGVREELSRGLFQFDVFNGLHFPFNVTEINAMIKIAARKFEERKTKGGLGRPDFEEYDLETDEQGRIRVGYVSTDFRTHPVGLVTRSMFGMHDRTKFEIFCYHVFQGGSGRDSINSVIRQGCEHFIDLGNPSLKEGTERIHSDRLHILVDLNVYTSGHRMDLFIPRPAPIQVSWLGLAISTGVRWIDYLVGDVSTIPYGWESLYPEKIVRMPHTYHISDHKQFYKIHPVPDRTEHGYKKDSFLFCNHQNVVRWDPYTFRLWCNMVKRVPNSVLVLKYHSSESANNLKEEARKNGLCVNDSHSEESQFRLMHGGSFETHLVTKSMCDLSVDTRYYNGHSTGLDLFWAGVPVVTYPSTTIAGRAAASFTTSAGIPEMIANNWQEYEDKAVELALDRERYHALDEKLHRERITMPLFDTKRWVKNWEGALEIMYQRLVNGEPPELINVIDKGPQLD